MKPTMFIVLMLAFTCMQAVVMATPSGVNVVSLEDAFQRDIGATSDPVIISLEDSAARRFVDCFEPGGKWISERSVNGYCPSTDEFYLCDASGNPAYLINNKDAIDPSYSEVASFLADDTSNEYCDVHNNAESSGYRAGIIAYIDGDAWYGYTIFDTVDAGRIYTYSYEGPDEIYTASEVSEDGGVIFW
jgi:hypothetical protein